jgi:AraC-like DNA-binding protein
MGSGITERKHTPTVSGSAYPADWRTAILPPATQEALDHLFASGLGACDRKAQEVVTNAVRLAQVERQPTVVALAKTFYMSRRALGRLCKAAQIPTPSHLLTFGRVLRAVVATQEGATVAEGCRANFSDPFTYSQTMKNLTGLRPRSLRLQGGGWITLTQRWLEVEEEAGRAACTTPPCPTCPACGSNL